ncbi:MAG: hypothetical protein RXR20_05160 [Paraburkholderia sp.]|uniref:hypothetical protein n=1 Tax=Burkholderiaceae TaxID=119060 RepID=UPI0010F6CF3C|nr:hypothetical protein [Burkholderia sp. 4M9327F10]
MMWLRAVVLAAGCWAVGAQATQYAEVWNPPETRHPVKSVKNHAPVGKKKVAAKGGAAAGKSKPHKPAAKRAALLADHKVAVHAGHKTAVANVGYSGKAHVKMAAGSESKKPFKMAQSKGVHVRTATHASGQKVAARHAAGHTGPGVASASAKPAVTPMAAHAAASTAPAQPAPVMASVTTKPAASGSDLPPILH